MVTVPPLPGGDEESEPVDVLAIDAARASLDAFGVTEPLAVYLAIDRTTLAGPDVADVAQRATGRAVAFAVAAGSPLTTTALFAGTVGAEFTLTADRWSGEVVRHEQRLGGVYGVRHAPVVGWVDEHHMSNLAGRPALVVVETRGQLEDQPEFVDALFASGASWVLHTRTANAQVADVADRFDHVTAQVVDDNSTDTQVFDALAASARAAIDNGS